ncbi:MAG: LysR family transcriptional regulator [Lachnospiraceae bacterium]|jgi:DNA-binding transcriptional LysR family regulator
MDLDDVKKFLQIVKYKSFRKAAVSTDQNASAFSRAVSRLENELHVSLFYKSHKPIHLTEAGYNFLPYARKMINLQSQSIEKTRTTAAELTGEISFGCLTGSSVQHAAEYIAAFHQLYPLVSFKLIVQDPDTLKTLLHSGECDLAILFNLYLCNWMKFRHLFDEEVAVWIRSDDPLACRKGAVDFSDLADRKLIIGRALEIQAFENRWMSQTKKKLDIVCRTNDYSAIINLVKKGVGVGIAPFPYNHVEEADGSIIRKQISNDGKLASVSYNLVWPNYGKMRNEVRKLIQSIADESDQI